MQLRKSIVALSMTAGLVGGGLAGAVLGVPGLTGAQEDETTTTEAPADAPDAPEAPDAPDSPEAPTPTPDAPPGDERPEPPSNEELQQRARDRLGGILAPLVEDGTLTQEQADKVIDTLLAAKGGRGPGFFGGRRHGHGPGFGRGHGFGGMRDAAEALGMEPRELGEALRDGKTLADVAREKGVDPQKVIDALVADVSEHLDRAVESGRLTREEAGERLAKATERITQRVNEGRPERRGRDEAEQGD